MLIKVCSDAYFFRHEVFWRAWNLRLGTPSLKSLPEDLCSGFLRSEKNPSTSAGFELANLGSRGEHGTPWPPRPTIELVQLPVKIRASCAVWLSRIFRTSHFCAVRESGNFQLLSTLVCSRTQAPYIVLKYVTPTLSSFIPAGVITFISFFVCHSEYVIYPFPHRRHCWSRCVLRFCCPRDVFVTYLVSFCELNPFNNLFSIDLQFRNLFFVSGHVCAPYSKTGSTHVSITSLLILILTNLLSKANFSFENFFHIITS